MADDLAALLAETTAVLRAAGIGQPGLDARRLIAAATHLNASEVLLRPDHIPSPAELGMLAEFVARRLAREPVSRIIGHRAFHGFDLEISSATLDPRPETETLVDGVLDLVARGLCAGGGAALRILDIGTGSGAILLALLQALPQATGIGVDISAEAIAVAARNAVKLGLAGRASFMESSWFDGVAGCFDAIVSNPPYIASADIAGLDADVRLYDPRAALDGGADGLEAYRILTARAGPHLARGGWLVMEVGDGQAGTVAELARAAFGVAGPVEVELWPDLAGKPRCVAIRQQ